MFQLNPADNEFNVFLPVVVVVAVGLVGSTLTLTGRLLYRHIRKSNSGRAVTILSQAFISLVGAAAIGIISFAVAVGIQMVLRVFR